MPINFHDEKNRFTYASRDADQTWMRKIDSIVDVTNKKVVDIGCGGGIYTKTLIEMGAAHVTGLDFSEQSLAGARVYCEGLSNVEFVKGNALQTNLTSNQYDVVLERAVTHHIDDLVANFQEINRILKEDGVCIIQDRTPEDCFLPGSDTHIRGFFFDQFPRLKEKEQNRRHTSETVKDAFSEAGFAHVEEHKLWETRKIYNTIEELSQDLLARTGRSLLHELTDEELQQLTAHIENSINVAPNDKINEQDRWTIWIAKKY
nr:class I SAM-dependent methyltransferase [Salirhabdus euzebyi]